VQNYTLNLRKLYHRVNLNFEFQNKKKQNRKRKNKRKRIKKGKHALGPNVTKARPTWPNPPRSPSQQPRRQVGPGNQTSHTRANH
jgi:hypothetical protein